MFQTSQLQKKSEQLLPRKVALAEEQDLIDFVEARVIGQPAAKTAIREIFRAYRNPLRDVSKPIGVRIFGGPSRTGKDTVVRTLAEYFHGSRYRRLKISGTDFMHKEHLANLSGAGRSLNGHAKIEEMTTTDPTQKEGYAEYAQHNITRYARGKDSKHAITFIEIDEWEKACWEFNLYHLGIFDEAKATLGNGAETDFRQCVFFLTTNLGMEEADRQAMGFDSPQQKSRLQAIIEKHFKTQAPQEFHNRVKELGGLVIFEHLTDYQIEQLVDMELQKFKQRISTQNNIALCLEVDKPSKAFFVGTALAEKQLSARVSTLVSEMSTRLFQPLGIYMANGNINNGDEVQVRLGEDGQPDFYRNQGLGLIGTAPECPAPAPLLQALNARSAESLVIHPERPTTGLSALQELPLLELTFLTQASNLAKESRINPHMLGEYEITIEDEHSFAPVSALALQLSDDIKHAMGLEIIRSSSNYQGEPGHPFSLTMVVRATFKQLWLLQVRYSTIKVKASANTPSVGIALPTAGKH